MFKFEIGHDLVITVSGEKGKCIGRAQYEESPNLYLIRYRAADGRAVEDWWKESALSRSE